MKKFLCLLPLLLFHFVVLLAQTADEVKVVAAVETLHKGLIERNKMVLDSITAKELTFGHSAGKIDDKSSFIDGALNGPLKFNSISPENLNVRIAGDDATVRYIFNAAAVNDGKPTELKFGVLMVWHKANDQWKLLARQGYKL